MFFIVLITEIPQHLEQCLASDKHSSNTCRMKERNCQILGWMLRTF